MGCGSPLRPHLLSLGQEEDASRTEAALVRPSLLTSPLAPNSNTDRHGWVLLSRMGTAQPCSFGRTHK
jgi:hypothetical protein